MILAIDGHDASGKTSVAREVARLAGARYAKPYDGTVGQLMRWLHEHDQGELVVEMGRAAIDYSLDVAGDAPRVVCDRHWLTVLAVTNLDRAALWRHGIITVLCWAPSDVTRDRLTARGDPNADLSTVDHYCDRYLALAKQYDVPTINTGEYGLDQAVDQAMRLADW
jgi:thymidylate kinase